MALAHKRLDPALVSVGFTAKEPIAFSGQDRVPVLTDRGATICGSREIADYLEDAYPDRPSLFGGAGGRALSLFVDSWAERTLFPALVKLVLCDVLAHLDPADAEYVRRTREQQIGKSFEAMRAERERSVGPWRGCLAPLRTRLRTSPYLCGAEPAYADYSVFGFFQWARMISAFPVLDTGDPVHAWRGRLLAAFGGLADAAPADDLS
jgi:glutathione S-transferase